MKNYEVIFNDGAFYRNVKATSKEYAFNKAYASLTVGQKNNWYNWIVIEK